MKDIKQKLEEASAPANEFMPNSKVIPLNSALFLLNLGIKGERQRIVEIIKSNSKGSFTDDAGNNCWYIDSLLDLITNTNK